MDPIPLFTTSLVGLGIFIISNQRYLFLYFAYNMFVQSSLKNVWGWQLLDQRINEHSSVQKTKLTSGLLYSQRQPPCHLFINRQDNACAAPTNYYLISTTLITFYSYINVYLHNIVNFLVASTKNKPVRLNLNVYLRLDRFTSLLGDQATLTFANFFLFALCCFYFKFCFVKYSTNRHKVYRHKHGYKQRINNDSQRNFFCVNKSRQSLTKT